MIREEEVVRKRALSASTPFGTNCCNLHMSTLVSHLMPLLTVLSPSDRSCQHVPSLVRLWLPGSSHSHKQAALGGSQALWTPNRKHFFEAEGAPSCTCKLESLHHAFSERNTLAPTSAHTAPSLRPQQQTWKTTPWSAVDPLQSLGHHM